jgi:hypothetical protein
LVTSEICAPAFLPSSGLVSASKDLELGHRINADGDVLAAVGAGIDVADAVDHQLIFSPAIAVDLETAQPADTTDCEGRRVDYAGDR